MAEIVSWYDIREKEAAAAARIATLIKQGYEIAASGCSAGSHYTYSWVLMVKHAN